MVRWLHHRPEVAWHSACVFLPGCIWYGLKDQPPDNPGASSASAPKDAHLPIDETQKHVSAFGIESHLDLGSGSFHHTMAPDFHCHIKGKQPFLKRRPSSRVLTLFKGLRFRHAEISL